MVEPELYGENRVESTLSGGNRVDSVFIGSLACRVEPV